MKTNRFNAAILFLSVFLLYFLTRSPGLDDADSIQFAMGTQDFDLWRHRPHPPGYPLYIFFGWLSDSVFGWNPEFSLHLASCLGGALFVTAWFWIVRMYFEEAFAWLVAATLAVTPIVWMTATKVLTDAPAIGLLSAQLFLALLHRQTGRKRDWIFSALLGAAATGVRPQLFPVTLVVLLLSLWQRRAPTRTWFGAASVFIGSCLIWLLPMWHLQWKLKPELSWWRVYPSLVYQQWRWRLDKPFAFIGADMSGPALLDRFNWHILGWFRIGLGFSESTPALIVGLILTFVGFAIYLGRRGKIDISFWKRQFGWLALYLLIVFCCLPFEQRYYLPVFPLLLIALTLGFYRLPGRWRLLALSWPVLLLSISLPLVKANHAEAAPPVALVRYLNDLYPPDRRRDVLLILRSCGRHAQWYAPEFRMHFDAVSLNEVPAPLLASAKVVYTDDPDLDVGSAWRIVPVKAFARSILISPKLAFVELYRLEPMSKDQSSSLLKESEKQ
jgi:4-amino-4-deoxy-L-arabinose transferase-like glycosyltransferase